VFFYVIVIVHTIPVYNSVFFCI